MEPHWDDILRLIASLKLGRLNVMSIMKTLQTGDRPTSLAQAIAEIGGSVGISAITPAKRFLPDRNHLFSVISCG
nr:Tn3 family transposase [Escherichia coli]